MRMRRAWLPIHAMILLTSVPAAADDDTPFTVSGEADYMSGELGGTTFIRGGLGSVARYDFGERLGLHVGIHSGFLRLRFDDAPVDGLVASGELRTPFEPSARLGGSYAVLTQPRFRLELATEIEFSLPGAEPDFERLEIALDGDTFDVTGFGAEQIHPVLFWKRVSVGAEFRLRFGRWEPSVGIAFEGIQAAIDLSLSEEAGATIRGLGHDTDRIERRYSNTQTFWLVPLRAGLGYRFGKDDVLRLGGQAAAGSGLLLGAELEYLHIW